MLCQSLLKCWRTKSLTGYGKQMSIVTVLLCTSLVVLWLCVIWSRRRFYRVQMQLPGPWGLPFIGLGLQMMRPERFLQYMELTSKKYKSPLISWMGSNCLLYVNDPETIETVFNSSSCTNKGKMYRFMSAAIGDGLFTSSSPRWNKHRRLLNPAFSRATINGFLPIFNEEANRLLNKLLEAQGQSLEIYELLKKSVLEASCQTTMGKKMNFQSDGSTAIFDAYNSITETCVKRMLSPWLYPDFIFRISSIHKCQQRVSAVLKNFVENLMQPGPKSTSTQQKAGGRHHHTSIDNGCNNVAMDITSKYNKSHVFIEHVRKHIEEGQLTWKDVIDEANVIVAATFETTSTALYLVCLCLAMHPESQDKLYNELVEVFSSKDNNNGASLNCNQIQLEHLERLPYTDMAINEAMRLFAPVPVVLRSASADLTLSNGVVVPQGTQIAIDIFNMQRSEAVWGSHARSYDPERHFGTASKPHPFAFVPFTKGLRMCIGYRYALMLMKVMVVKIFLNFRITTNARIEDLAIKGSISLKLCDYPLCTVERRKLADTSAHTNIYSK